MTRLYSELIGLETFEERLEYLMIGGNVGDYTFGFDRYINQDFYTSREWRDVRNAVIIRDEGCDLGVPGYEIHGSLLVHHINPMAASDITHRESWIVDPEFLITTTTTTHNAIHYGNRDRIPRLPVDRAPGDTKLW